MRFKNTKRLCRMTLKGSFRELSAHRTRFLSLPWRGPMSSVATFYV